MQRSVGPQRNLAARDTANPGDANRYALPRQTHRPRIAAVTTAPDRGVLAGIPVTGQRRHFVVEHLCYVHQAQGHQGPDELYLRVELQLTVVFPANDIDWAQRSTLLALSDRTEDTAHLGSFLSWGDGRLVNVIKPQGLEPLQFPTKFRSPSGCAT